ncbi:hypothetical protein C0991_002405 [Blastosporella zonata]|nr:hypothetical protein C0991_002405 [Blastosporella zonata]
MDIHLHNLPYDLNEWTVTRSIATVVHSKEFTPRLHDENAVERPLNFRVKLNPSKAGGVGNDGSGLLTFPTFAIGNKFLNWMADSPLKIKGKKIKFRRGGEPREGVALTLEKTPYVDPDIEEEYQQKLWDLSDKFRVNAVQFGVFYRPTYPAHEKDPLKPRAFSVEWERRYDVDSEGWLAFEYNHKVIRITLGSEMKDHIGSSIGINFASIQKIAIGYDGDPYICFDTLTPPILEEIEFYRQLTGNNAKDNRKFKRRIGSIHPGHQAVAAYAHHLRILLHNSSFDMADRFKEMCKIAGLADRMIIRCDGPNRVEASRIGFFAPKRLYNIQNEFKRLPWSVAFQLESLLHNGLLHTNDLLDLLSQVGSLCRAPQHGERYVAALLRHFHEKLEVRSIRQSPVKCFEEVRRTFTVIEGTLPRSNFLCSHVTFTPTRMILEGPYATQSNRVIRMYEDFLDHFVRVDFRDEDRLQYRWDREVDGSTYLQERVGGILKDGFELAGRRFEFLAYSSSALREHAVWFMDPFHHPEKGWVNSEYIRQTLGDFKDTDLLRQPSKYAARLAQAFTATDPSVAIRASEWEEVGDLGSTPYLFTDGVGTISKSLGDEIWAALCAGRGDHGLKSVQPSAYQIRFLGYKGVVGVDLQLDTHPNGIRMRLRKSMRKFSVSNVEFADIEIAQSFEHCNTCYLNRPLIMILEDLGVRMNSFVELQEIAVAEARTINDSSQQFRNVLDSHGLGRPYRLSHLLKRIEDLGLELNPRQNVPGFDDKFFRQLRQVSMMDILRDIKHSARIPIPESYTLVGVADEGPAYQEAGMDNVYTLPVGHIFGLYKACVQSSPDKEPRWLEGSCSILRSPVVHPGDVQRVRAIGKPPEGMLGQILESKQTPVVDALLGTRSLASKLGGGDVDGDQFSVICYEPLLPTDIDEAADYESAGTKTIDRDSTVDDICDFIVEYINSDVLGLLSDRLLVIADQSKDGIRDENCLWLARLCSQAVDYPKQGIPVDIDNDRLPHTLIRCKPDWHGAEVVSPRHTDYYESSRALGILYRSIILEDVDVYTADGEDPNDPLSLHLHSKVKPHLSPSQNHEALPAMFRRYVDELHYICTTHSLSNTPGIRLLEAEVVAGTILAKCSQKRHRKDRIYRMRLHASTLVRDVQRQIIEDLANASESQLIEGLSTAWAAWQHSRSLHYAFGARSFGLIALGVLFDCMDRLGGVQVVNSVAETENFDDDNTIM